MPISRSDVTLFKAYFLETQTQTPVLPGPQK